ncbi:peptidoglycan-binding protein [Saccharopolyspora rhizosphaerae]|uniref:Peptidoglycan-binding protein n=1 Tax=Saccharopolyspora rhizosphaerae TaxID=2492662 RepID=A0A426K5F4_9PSEU|nr:peptidoglycan-binding domain-containing protein [Saccharopolyspora rhizosphaerae]RRO20633.1 peptidoglycan-binding protein [Saccharopolyspora rhizosphaerae]
MMPVRAGALPFVLVVGAGALGAPRAEAAAAVNMDEVVVQSQVEPVTGQTKLPGDAGVEEVQRALSAKGHQTGADGWYGDETVEAYSQWQEDLGFTGIGANGIPGPSSLVKLGDGRFDVQRVIDVGDRTTYSGKPVNQRTADMLAEADGALSWRITVTQGSYQGCSDASACTHAGGGAIDISVKDLSTEQRWKTVEALREVGFAAWLRTPEQADWPYHVHAVAVGDTDTHREAADQVADYHAGKNGLASHAPDNTPEGYRASFTWWEAYERG